MVCRSKINSCDITVALLNVYSYLPARLNGIGDWKTIEPLVISANSSSVAVSLEGNTPGAMEFTRIGNCFNAKSAARIRDNCVVAAFEVTYAYCMHSKKIK